MTQKVYEYITEKAALAVIYAEDGAYNAAARVLRDLAKEVQQHADALNAAEVFEAKMEDGE